MNVTNVYGQQNVWNIQEIRSARIADHVSAPSGDTVSISPEAQELARATQGHTAEAPVKHFSAQAASAHEVREHTETDGEQKYYVIDLYSQTSSLIGKMMPQDMGIVFGPAEQASLERAGRFMRSVSAAYDRGKISADEVGELHRQYALSGEGYNWRTDPFTGERFAELGEYQLAVHQTYYSTILDMGLAVSGIDEEQRELSSEEVKAVEEEFIRRLKSDERTNALMQQLGVEV